MEASEILEKIKREHDALSAHLDEIESLLGDGSRISAELRSHIETLARELTEHMANEDLYLAPELAQSTNWGAVNTRELLEHHEGQRRELKATVALIMNEGADPAEAHAALRKLIAEMRRDIEDENKNFLNEEMLNDEIVRTDTVPG